MYSNVYEIMIEREVNASHIVENLRDLGFIVADGLILENLDDINPDYIYKYIAIPEGKSLADLDSTRQTLSFDITRRCLNDAIYKEYGEDIPKYCYVKEGKLKEVKMYYLYAHKATIDVQEPFSCAEIRYKYEKTLYITDNKHLVMKAFFASLPGLTSIFKNRESDLPNVFSLVEKTFSPTSHKTVDKLIYSFRTEEKI